MANLKRVLTIKDLVLDTTRELPVIAEVFEDNKKYSLKKGDLLWLTQLVEDDEQSTATIVEGSRWDAPDFTMSFNTDDKITFTLRTYSSVKNDISFGPIMDISGLANLGKSEGMVFGISAEMGSLEGMLKLVEGAGRIVCHEKKTITGFLAQGANNPLMIPGNYTGLFTKVR